MTLSSKFQISYGAGVEDEEEDNDKEEHYVGPRKERPKYYGLAPYDPKLDLKEGQYLIVRPPDEEIYPIW